MVTPFGVLVPCGVSMMPPPVLDHAAGVVRSISRTVAPAPSAEIVPMTFVTNRSSRRGGVDMAVPPAVASIAPVLNSALLGQAVVMTVPLAAASIVPVFCAP